MGVFGMGVFGMGVFGMGVFGMGVFGMGLFGMGVFGMGLFGMGVFGMGLFGMGVFGMGVLEHPGADQHWIGSTSVGCENMNLRPVSFCPSAHPEIQPSHPHKDNPSTPLAALIPPFSPPCFFPTTKQVYSNLPPHHMATSKTRPILRQDQRCKSGVAQCV
uniref:Uncharacterized protein n=1 Tax=Knipowitschia caucasica TaxID=637954 RepID=A0AAV2JZR2_KNICA